VQTISQPHRPAQRIDVALRTFITATLLSIAAAAVSAPVPTPTVTGPLPSDLSSPNKNYTFFATDLDLKSRGYV